MEHFKNKIIGSHSKKTYIWCRSKFQCEPCYECYYGKCARHFNLRIREHIRISPLAKKRVKPEGSAVSDHLLLSNHSPFFESFSVPTKENRKFGLELE